MDGMGNRYPPVLFADDNLSPLDLGQVSKIQPILDLYEQYYNVSGLNVNPRKSTALCINTPEKYSNRIERPWTIYPSSN